MRYISEAEYNSRMTLIKAKNESKERKRKLKEEEKKYNIKSKPKKAAKKISTSKFVLWVSVLLCLQIVVFCEYLMLKLSDATSIYALIGIPVALAPIILGYYNKSKAENTAGGIIFETAMKQNENQDSDNAVG